MATSENCIFCKIVAGEIPAAKVYEDERALAFGDVNPRGVKNDGRLVEELDWPEYIYP